MPSPTAAEVVAYLEARGGPTEGPLFLSADRAHKGSGRLTPSGLYVVVRSLAEKAEVPQRVSPHRLRHSAITDALDGLHGDVRRGRLFSRHAKVETLVAYDDRRRDAAGEVAALLASALGRPGRSGRAAATPASAGAVDHGDGGGAGAQRGEAR